MKRTKLGRTDIEVSEWCLGTMTYGRQTSEADAHRQLDSALDAGIDFLDTAEMYPVNPIRPETVGDTETIIGNWNVKTGRRKEYVIATKHSGQGQMVRPGQPISKASVRETFEGSLRRLQTDYIDLYQLHWPNRGSFQFRQNWTFDPTGQAPANEIFDEMVGVMEELAKLVAEGKLRSFGLSNESAWGTMMWLRAAEVAGGPRVSAMQNEYSLLFRLYDTDMAEVSHHEDVSLLAFSPLAAGILTGKYQDNATPPASRRVNQESLGGRITERVFGITQTYLDIAARHGVDPTHMAIAWCTSRPFHTIPIFGATTQAQLDHIIAGIETTLTDELLDEVSKAHRANPMPY